ncbi:cAMP-binding domain of CRP or a regulatory subunit of cAMP-dependent protein kinases [Filimonas lacunae]|uniref:cAMP-binding domain of CRP or a regulatory subunit of cAMP-dependent protein kinases n=1 Tax=Filimonas lacunae TaxID=477680 RepID=A0A173MGL9_9BACT|nr:Crp/Fnr family transcriptional regulator [Filimonas lacunae]BAV06772.1 Crp/Fnr family transcriptional regulator [Filimonas lacunae]SIT34386.1 cAMP-binding domain of CRP or a regulatory subunit of cAMP-dependent protein kinases [Filimonas lacunae]
MSDNIDEIELLKSALGASGMKPEAFDLSIPYWSIKQYKKGEFYNEYKNVCKHLGFVINGVFRIYRVNSETGEEKNMLFFTNHQFVASYKSFLAQTACDYYTEAVVDSTILYIHIDHLNTLYEQSHQWERFGRLVAEKAFHEVMVNTEGFLFKTPEDRYREMLEKHPDIFNAVPLYHIASYLGIQGPSLSRIRKRMVGK